MSSLKPAFHDSDTDIFARILADTSDTSDFLKLFLWQAERHADILAMILARMSVSVSWNAGLRTQFRQFACNPSGHDIAYDKSSNEEYYENLINSM